MTSDESPVDTDKEPTGPGWRGDDPDRDAQLSQDPTVTYPPAPEGDPS